MRIVQHMSDKKARTVGSLSELMSDVPRTTLYRQVKVLLEHGFLAITREVRIRGVYEREYLLKLDALQELASEESLEGNVNAFLMKLVSDFGSYFQEGRDPVKDRLFLSSNTLMLADSEYEQFIEEIFGVMKKYLNFSPGAGRKQRTLSIISSPGISKETESDNESSIESR
jgi:DNA-binding transcriptional ArsR family regulator